MATFAENEDHGDEEEEDDDDNEHEDESVDIDDDDESEYTVHDSDTDDDDTENNSMFGDSHTSFDDHDHYNDHDAADSLPSDATPARKYSNSQHPSTQEVVHAAGLAALRSTHLLEINRKRFELYNMGQSRKRVRYVPHCISIYLPL